MTNSNGARIGVWCKCDCGGNRMVPISQFRMGQVPRECKTCESKRPKPKTRKGTYSQAPKLKEQYPSEYDSWRVLKRGKKFNKTWSKSFVTFMRDLGPRPEDHILLKRDPTKKHEKGNSFWGLPPMAKELLLDGEPVTPAILERHFGVRKSFCRERQRRGETDAKKIICEWQARRSVRSWGKLGAFSAVSARRS